MKEISWQRSIPTVALTLIGILACAFLVYTATGKGRERSIIFRVGDGRQQRRRLSIANGEEQGDSSDRPIIYTFFNPLLEDAFVTQMSPEGDRLLVEEWKRQWHRQGWDPRVLNFEHAKQHPEYKVIADQLDNSNLDGYNKMCVWRWLAMATIGGGWQADYDTFPIKNFAHEAYPLPNDGQMTVHDQHIPDLVSGSGDEWLRLAHQITRSIMEHKVERTDHRKGHRAYTKWSDMKALEEWKKKIPDMYKKESRVFGSAFGKEDEVLGQPWSPQKCQERTPARIQCVHISHAALRKAKQFHLLHDGQKVNDRAAIAREWIETWHQSCGGLQEQQ